MASPVKVFVRCRPDEDNVSNGVIVCDESNRTVTHMQGLTHKQDPVFTFDKVFGPDSNQEAVYDQAISPFVDEALKGYNCTILAYGHTCSGKTYTMEGEMVKVGHELSAKAGVIPRAARKIFETLEAENTLYSVKATLFDIYNEEIIDLLAYEGPMKQKKTFSLKEDGKGSTVVLGLEEEMIYSEKDVFNLLKRGASRRSTSKILLTKRGCRYHSVFSITYHTKETNDENVELITKCGMLNFVDLAGSQKVHVRETDKSLLSLGRVIKALVKHSVHIPYRESKLTTLLRDSLGGNTKTCIIATISPSANLEETLCTLRYVYRARKITNKPKEADELSKQAEKMDLEPEFTIRKDVGSFIAAEFHIKEHFGSFIASKSNVTSDMEYKMKKMKDAYGSVLSTLKKLGDKSNIQSLSHLEELKSKTLFQVAEMQNFLKMACLEVKNVIFEFKHSLDERQHEEKPKKCIIYAVEMYCAEKKYYDKVNYYVYDEKKFSEIWKKSFNLLGDSKSLDIKKEEHMIELEEGVALEPINLIPYCHKDWSYIVFESHLFRVGGSYYSDLDKIRVIRTELRYKSAKAEYYLKEASKKVKILDLKNIENDWIDGPEMNFPRRNPHLLILKGKLYVVGGLFTYDEELLKNCIFMEVFENGAWKVLPNHPRLLGDPPENDYFISQIVVGAIEEKGFIIAGVDMENYTTDYCFYTYKPEDKVPKWEPYINISNTRAQMMMEELTLKTAVVSGKLMLWLCSGLQNMMYIMNLENDATYYLNLVEHLIVPPNNIQSSKPVLLMLEEGKFCLFWTVSGLKYLSGPLVYVGLHSTVFTLKISSQKPIVEIINSKFCLIPENYTHRLQAICIADIEDPKLTPFDY